MKVKGFTLIELLAVIVILAIIALIATPIILGIIKDAKEQTKEISIKNYISAVEQSIVRENLVNEFRPEECEIIEGKVICDGKELKVEVDGESPISGKIYILKGLVRNGTYLIYGNEISILNGNKEIVTKQIPEQKSFAEDSWETIELNVKAGNISVYESNLKEDINNTKEITLTSNDTEITGTYTVRIVNTQTPDECKTEGFSQTACGFVIEFEDIITTRVLNSPKKNSRWISCIIFICVYKRKYI